MSIVTSAKAFARKIVPAPIWSRLRTLNMRRTLDTFPARDVVHDYAGQRLTIHIADPLALGWYDCDWPEPDEMALLRRHQLREGATVFDLGAHQGVVALMLARTVGSNGKVVAVEANPHNARMAARNRDVNGAAQLVVEHAAVSDEPGEVTFNQGLNGQVDDGSGAWGRIRVPALTIDGLAERYGFPQVLFIDVEGYELHALRGARECLTHRPDCFVEMHVGAGLEKFGGSVQAVAEVFQDGYDLFMSSPEQPVPVAWEKEHAMQSQRFYLTAVAHA